MATIYHELAQEVSDFLLLVDPHQGGLTHAKALIFNFLSGLSVVLGVIIVLAQEEVSNSTIGLLLSFSGGVYIQIGAAECMTRVYANAKAPAARFVSLIVFSLGAFFIGIVLLDHKHCVVEGGAHAGHNH